MKASLKISRAFFILIQTIANGALVYLVPYIPFMPLQFFTVIAVNATIVYLATDVKEDPVSAQTTTNPSS